VRRKDGKPIRETTRRETARLLGFKRDPDKPDEWLQTGGGVLARWEGRAVQSVKTYEIRELLDDLASFNFSQLPKIFVRLVIHDDLAAPKSRGGS